MKNIKRIAFASAVTLLAIMTLYAQEARKVDPNSMPNRISMNITVPNQSQGASFGQRAEDGKISITLIENGCVVLFSSNSGYQVNIRTGAISEIPPSEYAAYANRVNQGLHAAGGAVSQGASLLGGDLHGGSIVSAAVSSVSNLSNAPVGAASAGYARNREAGKPDRIHFSIPDDKAETAVGLPDGDYELSFVILEKATSGLKDTLKTQVRLGFASINNVLKTKHDTAKNTINNVR